MDENVNNNPSVYQQTVQPAQPMQNHPIQPQPVYQQTVQPAAPQQVPVQPVPKAPVYTAEERASALKLCIISLALYTAPGIINSIIYLISVISEAYVNDLNYTLNHLYDSSYYDGPYTIITFIMYSTMVLCWIASHVLMIITRVKYPRYTFGKVLMIVYICFFAAYIIMLSIALAFVWWVCYTCGG